MAHKDLRPLVNKARNLATNMPHLAVELHYSHRAWVTDERVLGSQMRENFGSQMRGEPLLLVAPWLGMVPTTSDRQKRCCRSCAGRACVAAGAP